MTTFYTIPNKTLRSVLFRIPVPDFLQSLGLPDSLPIFSYGLLLLVAFSVQLFLSRWLARRRGADPDLVRDLSVEGMLAGVIGARVTYIVLFPEHFDSFTDMLAVYNGGLVLAGGVVVALLWLMFRIHRASHNYESLFASCLPPFPLAIGIGRLGCFLNGCCFGRPTDSFCGVHFPEGSIPHSFWDGASLHPSQLYATAMGATLTLLLFALLRLRPKTSGFTIGAFASLGYGIIRMIEEHFRGDSPGRMNGMTDGEIAGLIFIFLGAILLFAIKYRPEFFEPKA